MAVRLNLLSVYDNATTRAGSRPAAAAARATSMHVSWRSRPSEDQEEATTHRDIR
jgi:hypothetical protein